MKNPYTAEGCNLKFKGQQRSTFLSGGSTVEHIANLCNEAYHRRDAEIERYTNVIDKGKTTIRQLHGQLEKAKADHAEVAHLRLELAKANKEIGTLKKEVR
jgi:hypothetical protein